MKIYKYLWKNTTLIAYVSTLPIIASYNPLILVFFSFLSNSLCADLLFMVFLSYPLFLKWKDV